MGRQAHSWRHARFPGGAPRVTKTTVPISDELQNWEATRIPDENNYGSATPRWGSGKQTHGSLGLIKI